MKLSNKDILLALKWALLLFFMVLIGSEILHIYKYRYGSTSERRILLLLILIGLIQFKNKYTWALSVLIFAYGLYYIIAISGKYSSPVALDLTAHFSRFIKSYFNITSNIFLSAFEIYFYAAFLVAFISTPVRKWYKISFNTKQ